MNLLLDTCVVSELIKSHPEPAVIAFIRGQPEERLYLSVLTLGEIEKGISHLADERRQRKLRQWLEVDLQRRFEGRFLDVTPAVASRWGRIQGEAEGGGRRMPVIDGLLAATALHYGCAVATRNAADMEASGVEIVNPWPA